MGNIVSTGQQIFKYIKGDFFNACVDRNEYLMHIKKMKEIYEDFYQFIEDDELGNFEFFINKIENEKTQNDKNELSLFLRLISNVSNNHHRSPIFFKKIFKILDYLSCNIKQNFTNFEIFNILKNNQAIVLYLISQQVINIDQKIAFEILNISFGKKENYKCFFYPEIKSFISSDEVEIIENCMKKQDANVFDSFEEKRQKGENDSYLCELIRNDSIEEFVIYTSKTNLPLSSNIQNSIFETNLILNEKPPSLIEYAAFYGSIQIVKYLFINGVKLAPSLWIYSIHSNNPEMIYFLEENHVEPPNKNYFSCLLESIKCHHNGISDYIRDHLLTEQDENSSELKEIELRKILKSINLREMTEEINNKILFFYICRYEYYKFIEFYIKPKREIIEKRLIKNMLLF